METKEEVKTLYPKKWHLTGYLFIALGVLLSLNLFSDENQVISLMLGIPVEVQAIDIISAVFSVGIAVYSWGLIAMMKKLGEKNQYLNWFFYLSIITGFFDLVNTQTFLFYDEDSEAIKTIIGIVAITMLILAILYGRSLKKLEILPEQLRTNVGKAFMIIPSLFFLMALIIAFLDVDIENNIITEIIDLLDTLSLLCLLSMFMKKIDKGYCEGQIPVASQSEVTPSESEENTTTV